jgi:hypothetical protein
MDDKISKALNLQPMEIRKELIAAINNDSDDLDQAAINIRNLISRGTSTLESLIDLATASEQARTYEVTATLIRTLVDANKELAELSLKKAGKNINNDNRQVHNHMYVGSTTELLKLMKQSKESDNE